jgi:hypothetical protein
MAHRGTHSGRVGRHVADADQRARIADKERPTLEKLRGDCPWCWVVCASAAYRKPVAFAPLIIRWGQNASTLGALREVRCEARRPAASELVRRAGQVGAASSENDSSSPWWSRGLIELDEIPERHRKIGSAERVDTDLLLEARDDNRKAKRVEPDSINVRSSDSGSLLLVHLLEFGGDRRPQRHER